MTKEQIEKMSPEELQELIAKLQGENKQLAKDKETIQKDRDDIKAQFDKNQTNFQIRSTKSDNLRKWKNENTFKGRLMYQILLCKDTGSPITEDSISQALDGILVAVNEANKLKNNDTIIRFADRDVDIREIKITVIFQGAFKINEIADSFETLDSKRYFPESVLPLGFTPGTKMPTVREFEEFLHLIKSCFKYMREEYITFSSMHSTTNVAQAMKDCAHKSEEGKYYVARRANSDVYFIPYYVEELNDCLTWKNTYYNDFADKYVDEYFNEFVYPILKGKRD